MHQFKFYQQCILLIEFSIKKNKTKQKTWLDQLVERETLDFGVMSSGPHLGAEFT